MVLVTRINKVEQFYVNEDMIEFIEETPDTVISLNTGKKIVVMERAETVIAKIREQRIMVHHAIVDGSPPVKREIPTDAAPARLAPKT
ncbi:MAG: flagellar FlbD family protein [Oscillospiraceae bacterium]|nr:flagellar FlbD family protein [Oscillospiraceae bacterium]